MTQATWCYVACRGTWPLSGLYAFDVAETDGPPHLLEVGPAHELAALVAHPTLDVVYGAAATGVTGRVLGWTVPRPDSGGELFRTSSGGTEPCHLAVDPTGTMLLVVNYTSGSLAIAELTESGGLAGPRHLHRFSAEGSGVDPSRQDSSHPHQAVFGDGVLYISDLGADRIRCYRTHPEDGPAGFLGPETAYPVPPGTGPRHMVMLGDGRMAISGELAETVVFVDLESGGTVPAVVPSSLGGRTSRSRHRRNHVGDLTLTPDGGCLIVANRGFDTLGVVTADGRPELVDEVDAGVLWPQHFAWSGSRLLVAGWDSGAISVFDWDGSRLTASACLPAVPAPAWLLVTDRRP